MIFFTESLNALEDKDLDALMADLVADINDVEQRTLQAQKSSGSQQSTLTQPSAGLDSDIYSKSSPITGQFGDDLPPPPPDPDLDLPPPPPPPPTEPLTQVSLFWAFTSCFNFASGIWHWNSSAYPS